MAERVESVFFAAPLPQRAVADEPKADEKEVPKPAPAEAIAPTPESPAKKGEPMLSLDVGEDELRPGATVHVSCADCLDTQGELVIEGPRDRWSRFAKDVADGFNIPLPVAGTYRLTLRQPRDDGEWREQAHLTVEVNV